MEQIARAIRVEQGVLLAEDFNVTDQTNPPVDIPLAPSYTPSSHPVDPNVWLPPGPATFSPATTLLSSHVPYEQTRSQLKSTIYATPAFHLGTQPEINVPLTPTTPITTAALQGFDFYSDNLSPALSLPYEHYFTPFFLASSSASPSASYSVASMVSSDSHRSFSVSVSAAQTGCYDVNGSASTTTGISTRTFAQRSSLQRRYDQCNHLLNASSTIWYEPVGTTSVAMSTGTTMMSSINPSVVSIGGTNILTTMPNQAVTTRGVNSPLLAIPPFSYSSNLVTSTPQLQQQQQQQQQNYHLGLSNTTQCDMSSVVPHAAPVPIHYCQAVSFPSFSPIPSPMTQQRVQNAERKARTPRARATPPYSLTDDGFINYTKERCAKMYGSRSSNCDEEVDNNGSDYGDVDEMKRPANGYMMYRQEMWKEEKKSYTDKSMKASGAEISIVTGKHWHDEPSDVRQRFQRKSEFSTAIVALRGQGRRFKRGKGKAKSVAMDIAVDIKKEESPSEEIQSNSMSTSTSIGANTNTGTDDKINNSVTR
ncbi:hypothetical protein BGZ65_004857 [Modicella reniformis]|uniref:HMG box domain-containing protein n=1 Tax=Modicella reniformis TaxID=1440133 RepID=A0A9P6INW1_9FUNG|nr:hypothetical protein BGZ65_004857 [Modicella reniformis]